MSEGYVLEYQLQSPMVREKYDTIEEALARTWDIYANNIGYPRMLWNSTCTKSVRHEGQLFDHVKISYEKAHGKSFDEKPILKTKEVKLPKRPKAKPKEKLKTRNKSKGLLPPPKNKLPKKEGSKPKFKLRKKVNHEAIR